MRRSLTFVGASVALMACGNDHPSEFAGSSSSGASESSGSGGSSGILGASGGTNKIDECKKMDIVFVVDNSGSMMEEQANLAANFPKFVKVIDDYKTKVGEGRACKNFTVPVK